MKLEERDLHQELLHNAQIFFKLALGFWATTPSLGYYTTLVSGKHTAHKEELELTKEEEGKGMVIFEHVAIYTLVTQIDTIFKELYTNSERRKNDAACIAELIRNAFTHNPFAPKWLIDRKFEKRRYEVPDIIELDIRGLDGKYISRTDYGGPLSLLRLSELVMEQLKSISLNN